MGTHFFQNVQNLGIGSISAVHPTPCTAGFEPESRWRRGISAHNGGKFMFTFLRVFAVITMVCLFGVSHSFSHVASAAETNLPAPGLFQGKAGQSTNGSPVIRQRSAADSESLLRTIAPNRMVLALFDDTQLSFHVESRRNNKLGTVVWTGRLSEPQDGRVVLVSRNGRLSGTVYLPDRTYQIRSLYWNAPVIREIKNVMAPAGATLPPFPSVPESRIVELVNNERALEGMPPLRYNQKLETAARYHAHDMAVFDYCSHDRKDGRRFYERIFDTGYPVSKCGENVAAGFATPEEVFEAWLISPEHRVNILNPDFTEIGVGHTIARQTGSTRDYWAQDFGGAAPKDKIAANKPPAPLFNPFGFFAALTHGYGSRSANVQQRYGYLLDP